MSICEYIHLNKGGFVICDGVYILGVHHIVIDYTYDEVVLEDEKCQTIGVLSNPRDYKECKFVEKKDGKCSADNYVESCLIKDGNFMKVI